MESSGIKSWAETDRPREKLLLKGISSLSEAELMAILIRNGSRNESAVELARKILAAVNQDLNELAKLSVADLAKFHGMGTVKAIGIVAALEIGRRRREAEIKIRDKITGSKEVVNIFQPYLADLSHEEFWVLFLNRANRIIGKNKVSTGGISGTVVDARIIFKSAVECLASSVILCHNHPSGNASPSESDIRLTKRMKEAGALLEIPVIDHIIVTENGYYSFADEGVL